MIKKYFKRILTFLWSKLPKKLSYALLLKNLNGNPLNTIQPNENTSWNQKRDCNICKYLRNK